MKLEARWKEAQQTEGDFWDGIVRLDHGILGVLADNSAKAPLVRQQLGCIPQVCLEVGTGPFGIGIIGFLSEIPFRIALDPLPPIPMDSSNPLRQYMEQRRSAMRYLVGRGEEIPVQSKSIDLVICCNVIDHAADPDAIFGEIHRVLKPNGLLFLDVHTFSIVGLVKWHTWTKFKHKDEVLVKAHPHRMFETAVRRKLESHGFEARRVTGHTILSACIGHSRTSSFLGVRQAE